MTKTDLATLVSSFLLLFGCSAGETSHDLVVGNEGTGGTSVGRAGSGGSAIVLSGDASVSTALSAHIESPPGVTVTFITLSCSNACADVLAVAKGGFAPYSFSWEDGSTNPTRQVCPSSDRVYEVTVTDSGRQSPEFSRDPQVVRTSVTASVLVCPADGGAGGSGGDGGRAHDDCAFVHNPSFEGTPTVGLGDLGAALPDWKVCTATPDVNPLFATLPPSDGVSYLGAVAGPSDFLIESAGGTLCVPLEAGKPTSFTVDVAVSSYIGGAGRLELWGGTAMCGKDTLLWSSPDLTKVDVWQTYCVTLTPTQHLTNVVAWPVPVSGAAYVLVDNFRAVSSCP